MSLLDAARLTDEEVNQAYFTSKGARSWQGEAARDVANAATAKALWAAVDFLHEWVHGEALKLKYPADVTLANACAAAGIERPKEMLHED